MVGIYGAIKLAFRGDITGKKHSVDLNLAVGFLASSICAMTEI